jgi:hypothetical protein
VPYEALSDFVQNRDAKGGHWQVQKTMQNCLRKVVAVDINGFPRIACRRAIGSIWPSGKTSDNFICRKRR